MGFINFHLCEWPENVKRIPSGVIWQCDDCSKKYQLDKDDRWGTWDWREIDDDDDNVVKNDGE